MSMIKNLHVHFDDDVLSEGAAKKRLDDELANQKKTNVGPILNYSRKKLYEFGQSKACKETPKIVNLSSADDKRKEKLRYVLKNCDIFKSFKNCTSDGLSKSSGSDTNTPNEQVRSNFQQMISAAVTNAQQHNGEYATNRRRIGSGRIPDNYTAQDNVYAIGMDVRYMRNKLFRDDGKVVKNWKSGIDFNWNNSEMSRHSSDIDSMDAKSDLPEWANCGPISKHDIIDLHGFDGPEDDDETQKSESISASPPARNSTPTRLNSTKKSTKEEHFNFEDFLKLDLPASVNCSRDLGAGESRFSQFFGRDKPSHTNGKYGGNNYDTKSTQQFFEYHQKTNQKNFNMSNKLRSVNELEADWCPSNQTKSKDQNNHHNHQQQHQQQHQQMDANAVRMMINQLASTTVHQKQRSSSMNAAQTNFLLNLINKGAEGIYQYRLSQNATMKRPDAQLLLHRLVNGEITQYHILQQISNPNIHQRDRETLLAVFAFCNENQQWLVQQQEQQLKHKEQMSQQFRQLQMIQMKNGNMQPTPQELQLHTQTIMQNAMYKKQYEDQYRNSHGFKFGNQQNSKFQSYKPNNYATNQSYNRYNHKQQRQNQCGQNGLQFIQSQQQKSMWNRQNQVNQQSTYMNGSSNSGMRNTTELFTNTMPTFKFDAPSMSMANDKLSITVEK